MARHRKSFTGERLTASYKAKTTPTGRLMAEKYASETGLSLSEYLRAVAERKPVLSKQAGRDPTLLRSIQRELQAQGNNLNQLATVANSRRQIESAADLAELKARLIAVWDKVLAL